MRQFGLAAFAAIALTAGPAAAAEKLTCGEDYVTKAGDTIQLVAAQAYGPGLHRQLFVNILSHTLAQNAGALPEGTVVSIPCATGGGFEVPKEYWAGSSSRPIAVVMQTVGYDHNATESLPGLPPLLSALMDKALLEGRLEAKYEELDDDNVAAYRPFPANGGVGGMSYPWLRSDCADGAEQADQSGPLCTGALWSDPLFEVTSAVYVLSSSNIEDVRNRRLCIANESRAAVLASDEPAPSRMAIDGPAARCISMLQSGRVAAAILPDVLAARVNRKTPGAAPLRRAPGPTYSDTVHAVVDKAHPIGRRILKRLNDGIAELRTNGEWYQIVRSQLTLQLMN